MTTIDKRRFERVAIKRETGVYAEDSNGQRAGAVIVLGRGGFMLDVTGRYTNGSEHDFVIIDDSEGIRCEVHAIMRSELQEGTGFEIVDLQPDEAVEIGVMLGKYYSSGE